MSNDEGAEIVKKLKELQNYELTQTGLLVAEQYLAISTKVQELQNALFKRQHTDFEKIDESVNKLTKSSKRVEFATYGLIGLTIVLSILTALDVLF